MANFPNNTHPLVTAKGVQGRVLQAIEERPQTALIDAITTQVDADNVTETIASLGTVPAMTEWIGERNEKGFKEHSVNVTSKDYELTIPVPRRLLRLDKTGQAQLGNLADQVALRVANHPRKHLFDVLNGTVTATGYDGEALFSDSHAAGDQSMDNNIDADISTFPVTTHGTVAEPSPAELIFSVMQGVEQMRTFVDDQGEVINEDLSEMVAILPSRYETAGRIAFGANAINQQDGAGPNPLASEGLNITPVYSPRFTDTDAICLFEATGPVAPFLLVELEQPMIDVLGPESEYYKLNNQALILANRAYNLGIGRWDKACKITLV